MTLTILIVDSDDSAERIFEGFREDFPWELILLRATTLYEGFHRLVEETPELCIFEASLEGEPPLSLMKKYQEYCSEKKMRRLPHFIAMSDHPSATQEAACEYTCDLDEILEKPLDPDELRIAVIKSIRMSLREEQAYLKGLQHMLHVAEQERKEREAEQIKDKRQNQP